MAVTDLGFDSFADGKGKKGIDCSFERTRTLVYLTE